MALQLLLEESTPAEKVISLPTWTTNTDQSD
jgi:hypothetical protein